jgi:hypothetical protein
VNSYCQNNRRNEKDNFCENDHAWDKFCNRARTFPQQFPSAHKTSNAGVFVRDMILNTLNKIMTPIMLISVPF